MGMDVIHYQLHKIIMEDEIPNTFQNPYEYDLEKNQKLLFCSPEVEQWLNNQNIFTTPRTTITANWDLYLEELGYGLDVWEVTAISDSFANTVPFIELTNIETNKSVLLTDNIPLMEYKFFIIQVSIEADIRKPFCHQEIQPYLRGEELVITVSNFSGKGEKAYDILKKIAPLETEECQVLFFEKTHLVELAQYCLNTPQWNKIIISNFKNNSFVDINW